MTPPDTTPDVEHEHDRLVAVYGLCTVCRAADVAASAARRDASMAAAADAAPAAWKAAARRAIRTCAESLAEFTTDDVWLRCPRAGVEPRALGPLMLEAEAAGLIVRSDRTRPSTQPANHRRPVRVWLPAAAPLL